MNAIISKSFLESSLDQNHKHNDTFSKVTQLLISFERLHIQPPNKAQKYTTEHQNNTKTNSLGLKLRDRNDLPSGIPHKIILDLESNHSLRDAIDSVLVIMRVLV